MKEYISIEKESHVSSESSIKYWMKRHCLCGILVIFECQTYHVTSCFFWIEILSTLQILNQRKDEGFIEK